MTETLAEELARRQVLSADTAAGLAAAPDHIVAHGRGGSGTVTADPINRHGRDFAVGDIHGMFRALGRLLRDVAFDEARDRLFALGDLVDRGPESYVAEQLLAQPYCRAIRGNHDQLLLDAHRAGGPAVRLWIANGGGWYRHLADGAARVARLADQIAALPLARTVATESGEIGLVHAEVPHDRDWPGLLAALAAGRHVDTAAAIWGIGVGRAAVGEGAPPRDGAPVPGIARLVHGHFRVPRVAVLANQLLLDTGAEVRGHGYGTLSMLQLHPGAPVLHQIDSHDPAARARSGPPPTWPAGDADG